MPLEPGFECGFTFAFSATRATPRAEGRAAFFPGRARPPAGLVLACLVFLGLACRPAAGFGFGACCFGVRRFRGGVLTVMSMGLRE